MFEVGPGSIQCPVVTVMTSYVISDAVRMVLGWGHEARRAVREWGRGRLEQMETRILEKTSKSACAIELFCVEGT